MSPRDEEAAIKRALRVAENSVSPRRWWWAALAIALLLALAWFFRWEFVGGERGGQLVYMLDRWTGRLYVLSGETRQLVKDE